MNMKYKSIISTVTFLTLTVFFSCDVVEDYDAGATKVVDMTGDWYVKTFNGDSEVFDYKLISTYNTASDDGKQLWVDDKEHIWDFKVKANVNISNLTFAGENLDSKVGDYEITVNIINGRITKGEIITEGGNPTDGISFDIQFSDDDENKTYSIRGYKRTGFAEDEH